MPGHIEAPKSPWVFVRQALPISIAEICCSSDVLPRLVALPFSLSGDVPGYFEGPIRVSVSFLEDTPTFLSLKSFVLSVSVGGNGSPFLLPLCAAID